MKLGTNQSLYVVFNPELNITKIGISTNVQARLSSLRGDSGCDLQLIYYSSPISAAAIFEGRAHEILAGKRKMGEWFNVDPEEAVRVVKEVVEDAMIDSIVTEYLSRRTITDIARDRGVTRQAIISKLKTYGVYGRGRYRNLGVVPFSVREESLTPSAPPSRPSPSCPGDWEDIKILEGSRHVGKLDRVAPNIYSGESGYRIKIYLPAKGWIEASADSLDRAKAYVDYLKSGGEIK